MLSLLWSIKSMTSQNSFGGGLRFVRYLYGLLFHFVFVSVFPLKPFRQSVLLGSRFITKHERVKMSKIHDKKKKKNNIKDCFGFRLFQQHDATRNSITMMSIQSGHAQEHITITIWTTLTKCCCLWCMLFRQHLIFFSCNQIHRSALLKAAFSGEKWLVV
jgi:hypothetical protein